MNLKEKLQKYRGIDLKIVAYSALPIYWVMLLASTFLHWNWRWHWVTKYVFHPTRLASTWSIQRIPLSLLLAPRTVGLFACTLVIRSLSLLTLAWSLNPCALVGRLAAWSLRACKLATLLPERSVILWVFKFHINVYRNTRLVWTCPSMPCSPGIRCPGLVPGRCDCLSWWLSTSTART